MRTWPAFSRVYCRSMRRMLTIAVALLCFGATARNESGLVPGPVNYRTLERAIKAIYATGQFDDVVASCELADGRSALTFALKERPVLGAFDVAGTDRISRSS